MGQQSSEREKWNPRTKKSEFQILKTRERNLDFQGLTRFQTPLWDVCEKMKRALPFF
jgi:hypothetical protein